MDPNLLCCWRFGSGQDTHFGKYILEAGLGLHVFPNWYMRDNSFNRIVPVQVSEPLIGRIFGGIVASPYTPWQSHDTCCVVPLCFWTHKVLGDAALQALGDPCFICMGEGGSFRVSGQT